MTTRESVHGIVDRLPDESLAAAEDALRALTPPEQDDDLLEWLQNVPEEDEELSPEELKAVRQWRENPRPGIQLTWDELEQLVFGTTPG